MGILSGYVIAITGTLSKVRAQVIKDIEARGGRFAASVTGSCTHLVAANPYLDTVKFRKARDMGVQIVDEGFLKTGKVAQVFGEADALVEDGDGPKVTWEYYDEYGNWSSYSDGAHGIVEAAFQDWIKDPEVDVRPVKSGFFIYRINFNEYTQQNMEVAPFTVRKVRRVVDGVPQGEVPPSPKKSHKKVEDDEEEKPKKKAAPKKKATKAKKKDEEEEEEEEEEAPKKKKAAPKKKASPKKRAASKKKNDVEEEEEEEEEEPKGKKTKKQPATKKAKTAKKGGDVFEGLTFAITGKLSKPRAELEKLITSNGGAVAKTLTKKVTHLITVESGDDSAKLQKARDGGVVVLSEDFLNDAIEDGELPAKLDAYLIE